MNPTPQSATEEFLVAIMAYCMTWELAGPRASEHWDAIRTFVSRDSKMDERLKWVVELYEESHPSAQEERSIISRIGMHLVRPHDVLRIRDRILHLLPQSLRTVAAGHSLMRGLSVPDDYGKLKIWLLGWRGNFKKHTQVVELPLSEREADFNRFLEQPYFLEAFRSLWHVEPKRRNNRQTRVLVCIGASLSQMIHVDDSVDFEFWGQRFGDACHLSQQTRSELISLQEVMVQFTYDAQELAYRLFVDAKEVDKRNLMNFIEQYRDELSDFSRELSNQMLFIRH